VKAISDWIAGHKAALASTVTVLVAASGAAQPPYSTVLYAVALVLAYIAQSPMPAAPH
jgi:hypothetical protein